MAMQHLASYSTALDLIYAGINGSDQSWRYCRLVPLRSQSLWPLFQIVICRHFLSCLCTASSRQTENVYTSSVTTIYFPAVFRITRMVETYIWYDVSLVRQCKEVKLRDIPVRMTFCCRVNCILIANCDELGQVFLPRKPISGHNRHGLFAKRQFCIQWLHQLLRQHVWRLNVLCYSFAGFLH